MGVDLAAVFARAGCVGSLCVQDDAAGEVALLPDGPVVAASVIKVLGSRCWSPSRRRRRSSAAGSTRSGGSG